MTAPDNLTFSGIVLGGLASEGDGGEVYTGTSRSSATGAMVYLPTVGIVLVCWVPLRKPH